MNCKLFNVLCFAAGAAIGSVATWKFVKTKYEQIAQEEIESVKETFRNRERDIEATAPAKVVAQITAEKPDIMEYAAKLKEFGYAAEIKEDSDEDLDEEYEEEEEDEDMSDEPYVISPDDFDENGYETESLTYYADGVLTDSYGEIIEKEDADDMIGLESLTHFGEYEDDSVFVRNDSRECDYEILKDTRNYSDTFSHELED